MAPSPHEFAAFSPPSPLPLPLPPPPPLPSLAPQVLPLPRSCLLRTDVLYPPGSHHRPITAMQLSPVDLWMQPEWTIRLVSFYRAPAMHPGAGEFMPSALLCRALQLLLKHYPLLSGRLDGPLADGSLRILHGGASELGVPFNTASASVPLAALSLAPGEYASLSSLPASLELLPPFDYTRPLAHSLFSVQHTRFTCGGVSVAFHVHHMATDMVSLVGLLRDWRDLYRALCVGDPEPFLDVDPVCERSVLIPQLSMEQMQMAASEYAGDVYMVKPTPDAADAAADPAAPAAPAAASASPAPVVPSARCLTRVLFFSREELSRMVLAASTSPSCTSPWLSTFETLAAHLMRLVHRARFAFSPAAASASAASGKDDAAALLSASIATTVAAGSSAGSSLNSSLNSSVGSVSSSSSSSSSASASAPPAAATLSPTPSSSPSAASASASSVPDFLPRLWPNGTPLLSALLVSNIRPRYAPALPAHFFGNAVTKVCAFVPTVMALRDDTTFVGLGSTAAAVHDALASLDLLQIMRSLCWTLSQARKDLIQLRVPESRELCITSWAKLGLYEALEFNEGAMPVRVAPVYAAEGVDGLFTIMDAPPVAVGAGSGAGSKSGGGGLEVIVSLREDHLARFMADPELRRFDPATQQQIHATPKTIRATPSPPAPQQPLSQQSSPSPAAAMSSQQ